MSVRVKRIYAPAERDDGVRVLVDRLWPRGLTREHAAIRHWCREVAPTTELRRWYGHRPDRMAEFRAHYLAELSDGAAADALARLRGLTGRGCSVTLLTAVTVVEGSHASVLGELLTGPSERG